VEVGIDFGPTHWNVRYDVRGFAARMVRHFGGTWNTYEDHPPGMGLDAVSVDFWGIGGRGDKLRSRRIRRMARRALHMEERPQIRLMIAERRIWTPAEGWHPHRYDPAWDDGHLHVTFW
jgi:hypothetical protein